MFTQPVASPPPGPPPTSSTTTVTSARPSRLRGLSYLRNYTHSHILSRETSSANNSPSSNLSRRSSANNLTRSSSSPSSPSNNAAERSTTRLQQTISSPDRSASGPFVERPTPANPPVIPAAAAEASRRTPPPGLPTSLIESSSPTPASAAHTSNNSSSDNVNMATATTAPAAVATSDGPAAAAAPSDATPSIRLSSYYDPRSTRPSLTFSTISRTLPNGNEVIRVGRYSERDTQTMANAQGNQASAAPVGFKSKVVSRRHCEFWSEDGKWYIKDVKSSSGTFLNHIRLSPPSQESKAFPVNDGDIVQLGIDFKGGEEMIFRCVKMRLELNRGWQNKLNNFKYDDLVPVNHRFC